MKKLLILLTATLVAFSLMAGGQKEAPAGSGSEEKSVTLVYAEVNPLDSIVGQTGLKFKEEVEKLSNGTVMIDIQHSGVLGAEHDVLDAMLGGGGTIDMARISAFALTSYGGEKSKLLSIPYTFTSRELFWNFATSDLAPEFLMEPHENGTGIRGLFYGEEGFRHFFGTKPLKSIDDMQGLKVRISNDPIAQGMVKGIGGDPTQVSYNELYSALQSGVVDAAEQPIANYKSKAFNEVAPYMILDCGIGLLTPPVGAVLFIGSAVGKVSIERVVKATLPFYILMIVTLMLVTFIPSISLLLPSLFR